jgi:hypothetical protein
LLDPVTLAVVDSIPTTALPRPQDLWEVLACKGSASVLLVGSRDLAIYDLQNRRVLRAIARPASGRVDATSSCDMVALGNYPSDARYPITDGRVWIFSDLLQRRDSIDLATVLERTPASLGGPIAIGVAFSVDARTLWVRSGWNSSRLSDVREPAQLLGFRLADKVLVARVPLGGFSAGDLRRVR